MKQFYAFIIVVLITSCGSSESAAKHVTKTKVETEVQTLQDKDFTTTEHVAIKTNNIKKDSIFIEEKNIRIPDSIIVTKFEEQPHVEFNQKVSKQEGYIHNLFSKLLQKHVSEKGQVDYKSFKKSYERLLGYISTLQKIYPQLNSFSREEKLAYWINAYNALTIDLILRNYPLKSIKDIDKPWDQRLWKFGDKWLNLNHIEHNILRKMDEPRIHFAIVCASYSCPKLQNDAFTASELEDQLTQATKDFLSDSDRNKISENNIQLSKIFRWFSKDFETDGTLIDFLNNYTEVKISPNAKKSFLNYNWDLND